MGGISRVVVGWWGGDGVDYDGEVWERVGSGVGWRSCGGDDGMGVVLVMEG